MAIDFSQAGFEAQKIPPEPRFPDRGLLILGGARCVWEDVRQNQHRIPDWHVMTVNDIAMHAPFHVKHAYSNHAYLLVHWVGGRSPSKKSAHGAPMRHTGNRDSHGAIWWPLPMHGTSALNAVYCALMMDYREIILCGIPLDDSGHYYDPPWIKSNFTREVPDRDQGPRYWERAAETVFAGRVRSMSGRTRELLGPPDG